VMVPLPHATADHQAANARAVATAGGAVVVEDAALDGPALVAAAAPLLADPDRLTAMAAGMRSQAHPAAAEELAALVVEASGRATRDQYLAEVAAAATPIDREASGWFESAAPGGGPTVQRRVDRRTKRMEAYPPIDRKARSAQGLAPGGPDTQGPGFGGGTPPVQNPEPGGAAFQGPDVGEAHRNGQDTRGGPPTDQDTGGGPPTDQEEARGSGPPTDQDAGP
jgi:Glycosyltransferase family 28 C-terminal domain